MKTQILMTIRFKESSDLTNIKFSDVYHGTDIKGNKCFDVDGKQNVLFSHPSPASNGESFIVSSFGIYNSIFANNANRNSLYNIEDLVREVKSNSKKLIKNRNYSVRKSTVKGKVIEDNGWKVISFNLDFDRVNQFKNDNDFFKKIVEFINGERRDFLGEIDGLKIEPIRFNGDLLLKGNEVGLVRLNSGTHYTSDNKSALKSEMPILDREEKDYPIRNSDLNDDLGMRFFLEANGYSMTKVNK